MICKEVRGGKQETLASDRAYILGEVLELVIPEGSHSVHPVCFILHSSEVRWTEHAEQTLRMLALKETCSEVMLLIDTDRTLWES